MHKPDLHSGIGPAKGESSINARLTHEIPRPRDWQDFQRKCMILFQEELRDPNAREYGRNGQNQHGIDILGRRSAKHDHQVGVQCKHKGHKEKLTYDEMLSDSRATLGLQAKLKEIIFATTAENDTVADDGAQRVETLLREEGYDVTIVVFGWGNLETLIGKHELAYSAFCPEIMAAGRRSLAGLSGPGDAVATLASELLKHLQTSGFSMPMPEDKSAPGKWDGEDPALHARIDVLRDMFAKEREPVAARRAMLGLLETLDADKMPWAVYRLQTNLGSAEYNLGDLKGGAARYEIAHSIKPEYPRAIANLAIARVMQRRYEEAMDLARSALSGPEPAEIAIQYLLHAAGLSEYRGDPVDLIPPGHVGTKNADLGLADFIMRRAEPGWEIRTLDICRRHADDRDFKLAFSTAALSSAISASSMFVGGAGPLTAEELQRATDDMVEIAKHAIDVGFSNETDLLAYLNNAGALLRLSGRFVECQAFLESAVARMPRDPHLKRLLALTQAANGSNENAAATLTSEISPQSAILCAEFQSAFDAPGARERLERMDRSSFDKADQEMYWRTMSHVGLRLQDPGLVRAAVSASRYLDCEPIQIDLMEITADYMDQEEAVADRRLLDLASTLADDVDPALRFVVAIHLREHGHARETAELLRGHVDLTRKNPTAALYLQALAAARRDAEFAEAIGRSAQDILDDPEILWVVAAHAWNIGDLERSEAASTQLSKAMPRNLMARLLQIDLLARRGQTAAIMEALDCDLENFETARYHDLARLVRLLVRFGQGERAARLSYRLFMENHGAPEAWMAHSTVILSTGTLLREGGEPLWTVSEVAQEAAVDIEYEDGEKVLIVIEPSQGLRDLDQCGYEPGHPLVRAMIGLKTGDRFKAPDGREASVIEIRHKYVAQFHYILKHYNNRFPQSGGIGPVFRGKPGVSVGKLQKFLAEQGEWQTEQVHAYATGPMSLSMLALHIGRDEIDTAEFLAASRIAIKVSSNLPDERLLADIDLKENGDRGCVMDLYTFWVASQLGALPVIEKTCGRLHLPRSVLEHLHVKRSELSRFTKPDHAAETGIEATPPAGATVIPDRLRAAIEWAEANATILPSEVSEGVPPFISDHISLSGTHIYDAVLIAYASGLVLVTDDFPMRALLREFSGHAGAALHQVSFHALAARDVELDTHIELVARLSMAGQKSLGGDGRMLARAFEMDVLDRGNIGWRFKALAETLGGAAAERLSHMGASAEAIRRIWTAAAPIGAKERATGLTLEMLFRGRQHDYHLLAEPIVRHIGSVRVARYIDDWLTGHFMKHGPS